MGNQNEKLRDTLVMFLPTFIHYKNDDENFFRMEQLLLSKLKECNTTLPFFASLNNRMFVITEEGVDFTENYVDISHHDGNIQNK